MKIEIREFGESELDLNFFHFILKYDYLCIFRAFGDLHTAALVLARMHH
jgi:hypothetical protein